MPFPEAIAKAQRASAASDIREAYDHVERIGSMLAEIGRPHLINLSATELTALRSSVKNAKDSLFYARTIVEVEPGA